MVRSLRLAVALALGTLSVSAYALGLGDIKTHSELDQKFSADISLVSTDSEGIDGLRVQLASPRAFQQAGVQRPYFLSLLKFQPRMQNGKAVIHVSSDFPIREPFLDFLIEANWPRGHLVREYTVLLNPPVMTRHLAPRIAPVIAHSTAAAKPAAVAKPTPVAKPTSVAKRRTVTRAAAAATHTAKTPSTKASGGKYGPVRADQTLWGIAQRLRPKGVSLAQMMIALQHANPDAFIGDNINRLRKGWILRVPDTKEILSLSRAQARMAYREQTQAWRAHKQTGGPTAGATNAGTTVAAPAEHGELHIASARPKGQGAAGAGADTGKHIGNVKAMRRQLMQERANIATSRTETKEIRGQVSKVQKRVKDMQRLVSLKDQQLAELQEQIAENKNKQPGLKTVEAAVAASEQKPAASTAATTAAAAATQGQTPAKGAGTAASTTPTKTTSGTTTSGTTTSGTTVAAANEAAHGSAGPAGSTSQVKSKPEAAKPTKEEPKAKLKSMLTPPSPMHQTVGFLARYWPYLAGAGAVVLLLLILLMTRRKSSAGTGTGGLGAQPLPADGLPPLDEESTEVSAPVDEEADLDGLASDDTSFLSEFSPSDIKSLRDDTTEVDPISEADVYIAYGRYQQATELLDQALQKEPERLALKHKLLEVYYATGNRDGFVALAQQIVGAGQDMADAKAWTRAREMGRELDPGNQLFSGDEAETSQELDSLSLGDLHTETPTELNQEDEDLSNLNSELVAKPAAGDGADDDLSAQELALDLDDFDEYSEPLEEVESLELELPGFDSEELISILDPAESKAAPPSETAPKAEEAQSAIEAEDSALSPDDLVAELDALSEFSMLDEGDGARFGTAGTDSSMDQNQLSTIPESESESMADTESQSSVMSSGLSLDKLSGDSSLDSIEFPDLMGGQGDDDAVGTKLELARAYLEMGDSDGARSILDEVQAEGSAAQKNEATQLLAQLA